MNLREISIFKDLSDEDLKILTQKTKFEEKIYPKNSQIFTVGEVTGAMYYLVEGSILVYKIDPNGKRFIIRKFNKPAIFGEVYSYLDEPFDFSAQAETDSKVLLIHDFKKLFATDTPKDFLIAYTKLVSKKCLQLSRSNQITSQPTLRQKIAKYLIINEENGVVKTNLSREEWADILATTRPSLSRELSNMVDDGLIEIKNKTIKIKNRALIADII
ncbi:Crp/Fnr family transcriptional regulator [uncultured Anaerococcus sp.]|uniref:Crp/Fnr family transcriptional regulator n=1 Tax=Anaerococcus sp. AH8042_DFU013_CI05 TaxID=3385202 RepID=UPI0025E0374F|nr:Crp/Fnr family transcriptional regulator [uncultured Anaerococcus sp.]